MHIVTVVKRRRLLFMTFRGRIRWAGHVEYIYERETRDEVGSRASEEERVRERRSVAWELRPDVATCPMTARG